MYRTNLTNYDFIIKFHELLIKLFNESKEEAYFF